MKISPLPNFGSFGALVDNVDMDNMDDDTWHELGKLFIDKLVVVMRDIKMSKTQYLDWMPKWGPLKANIRAYLTGKYGHDFDATRPETWSNLEEKDRRWLETRKWQLEESGDGRFLTRIYGRQDDQGHSLGYFSHGEVYWHSNECSTLTFSPAVSLLGWQMMQGSATGFVQTIDFYENVSESWRSELNEMVLVHRYQRGRMNDNEHTDDNLALHMQMAFCPVDDAETPLVCTAPNGRKGLHYSLNTRAEIKGLTQQQTQDVFDKLDREIFKNGWIYDHYYQNDNDLVLFDNSVTLHRRLGGDPDRKAFRMQFDISPLIDKPWLPWQHMPKYNEQYVHLTHELIDIIGGDLKNRFKLP
jgi:alpha-ketoglutarate-dependent taurine dioxygenase